MRSVKFRYKDLTFKKLNKREKLIRQVLNIFTSGTIQKLFGCIKNRRLSMRTLNTGKSYFDRDGNQFRIFFRETFLWESMF